MLPIPIEATANIDVDSKDSCNCVFFCCSRKNDKKKEADEKVKPVSETALKPRPENELTLSSRKWSIFSKKKPKPESLGVSVSSSEGG